MKIVLNGLELPRKAEDGQTVGEVLAELQKEIVQNGKVITRIQLDGRDLSRSWRRQQELTASVTRAESLELTIMEPGFLQRQALTDTGELVVKLVERSKPLGRMFRVGDEVSANNGLANYLDDIKLIMTSLDHSTRKLPHLLDNSPFRQEVIQAANRMLPTLDRIYKAQASGDYIMVADEIEYEMKDLLEECNEVVAKAQRQLDVVHEVE